MCGKIYAPDSKLSSWDIAGLPTPSSVVYPRYGWGTICDEYKKRDEKAAKEQKKQEKEKT